MGDWLLNLPISWMAVVIFAATYLIAACVYLLVVRLAVGDRARAFKAFSPGMLPVLGTIFALLVAFVAVQVWNDFDKAKLAVATEATACGPLIRQRAQLSGRACRSDLRCANWFGHAIEDGDALTAAAG
jgi:hypothetical protein